MRRRTVARLLLALALASCSSNPRPPRQNVVEQAGVAAIVSVGPSYVIAGDIYSYRPIASAADGSIVWQLAVGPDGMTMDEGQLRWVPTSDQAGAHPIKVQGTFGDQVIEQEYEITVGQLTPRASDDISATTGGQVSVTSPLSVINGAAANFGAGALRKDTTVEIAEVDSAPLLPNTEGSNSVVHFAPSGTVFQRPIFVVLPFEPTDDFDVTKLRAYTYNVETGRYEPIEIERVDLDNHLVIAHASHFSLYTAAQQSLNLTATAGLMPESSSCEGRLAVANELSQGLDKLEVASINNLSDAMKALLSSPGDASVSDLIRNEGFRGSLQFVFVRDVGQGTGGARVVLGTRAQVNTLFVDDTGAAKVVIADALGNILDTKQYNDVAGSFSDIADRLRGKASHTIVDAPENTELNTSGRLHLIYADVDSSTNGVSLAALGIASVESAVSDLGTLDTLGDDYDVDCDGLRNAFDLINDAQRPRITWSPTEAVTIVEGTETSLFAQVVDTDGTVQSSWEIIAGAETSQLGDLKDAEEGQQGRLFSATAAGFYTVRYTATVGDETLQTRFNIQVLPQPAQNTPPVCLPTALTANASEGENVTIFAVVDDAETPTDALDIEWGLSVDTGSETQFIPSTAIIGRGSVVGFTALSAGTYAIGCRAFDGKVWGDVASTTVAVVPANANRAPIDFSVTPAGATLVVGDEVVLKATAKDPDGDSVNFDWVHPFGDALVLTQSRSVATVTPASAGTYSLLVSVTDGTAPPQFLPISLVVLREPVGNPNTDPDEDGDGFPASSDCNDRDRNIHPGAKDICGDLIDQDCSGTALTNDCDGDGHNAPEDCDDDNRDIHPERHEICDGIDNNCDGKVDEVFGIGDECKVGVGECEERGEMRCAPDGLGALCDATPGEPQDEVCGDGKDNDCTGAVDDAAGCVPPTCACNVSSECDAGCACDPDCITTCQCDSGPGCDSGCECDPECHPPCECDVDDSKCDEDPNDAAGTCHCDPQCNPGCACDADFGVCNEKPDGSLCDCDPHCHLFCGCDFVPGQCEEACFCDFDCGQPFCTCDTNPGACDPDPNDPSGNCQCDPACECQCDTTPEQCDEGCACDPACSPPPCDCNVTQEVCDVEEANPAGFCHCDPECIPECICDVTDDQCDEGCVCDFDCPPAPCACDSSDACDADPADSTAPFCACDHDCGFVCGCDRDDSKCDEGCFCDLQCDSPGCFCDTTSGQCDDDPSDPTGKCHCDPECNPGCACDTTFGQCDDGAAGATFCDCDPHCGEFCGCDQVFGQCEAGCFCDFDCGPGLCLCDTTHDSCDPDPNDPSGECQCDPKCDCQCDATPEQCDEGCACDHFCPPPCDCDTTAEECDPESGNPTGFCHCDPKCVPFCACDATAGQCDEGCLCDKDCERPPCDCQTSDDCDPDPNDPSAFCACDLDCGLVCGCDRDRDACDEGCHCDFLCHTSGCFCDAVGGQCDPDPNNPGESCPCDLDCQSTCHCEAGPGCDSDPNDPTGLCQCDPECGPPCACDTTMFQCDVDPNDPTGQCQCDLDCNHSCQCDTTLGQCDDKADGTFCECDPHCGEFCGCDFLPGTCEEACFCDFDCGPGSCLCDATPEACDPDPNDPSGECQCDPNCACQCDQTAGQCDEGCACDPVCPPVCECDTTSTDCDPEPGNPAGFCHCDPLCAPACACDLASPGECDVTCLCDKDCVPPPCGCNATNACDPEPNDPSTFCACDLDCGLVCGCDRDPGKCDTGCFCDVMCGGGTFCPCDFGPFECDPDPNDPTGQCQCDPQCGGGTTCPCDVATGCDPDPNDPTGQCQCDPQCGGGTTCPCDVATGCDPDPNDPTGQCQCDPECHSPQ